jgi:3',5'-cyclic AMP phosphodiesterase CpdA
VTTFRLLHASDLHFYRREHTVGLPDSLPRLIKGEIGLWGVNLVSSHDLPLAEALAHFAYVNRAGLDAVVLTGDLATTGDVEDLALARLFVSATPAEGDYQTPDGFPTLAAADLPVLLLPGNHDRYGKWYKLFPPGGTNFDALFGDYWGAGQGVQTLWTGSRHGAALAVIGADFCLGDGDAGGLVVYGHLGRGRVYDNLAHQLVEQSARARAENPACAVVWAIHFEPEAGEDSLALYDPEGRLAGAVAEARPAAILCGHTHLESQRKAFAGVDGLVCLCGTTTQWHAPYGNYLQVIEVEVDETGAAAPAVALRKFRFEQAGFVEVD